MTGPVCPRCRGCGQVANTEVGEPWTEWLALPVQSQVAIRMGLVGPRLCPGCSGTGEFIVLGGPDPFAHERVGDCPAEAGSEAAYYWCTRDAGHPLPHVASAGPVLGVCAVWPPYREVPATDQEVAS